MLTNGGTSPRTRVNRLGPPHNINLQPEPSINGHPRTDTNGWSLTKKAYMGEMRAKDEFYKNLNSLAPSL